MDRLILLISFEITRTTDTVHPVNAYQYVIRDVRSLGEDVSVHQIMRMG